MKVNLFKTSEEERLDIYYNEMDSKIRNIIETASSKPAILKGRDGDSSFMVNIDDIYYFDYVDGNTFAYLKRDVYMVDKSLKDLEYDLVNLGFVRINKSQIVNIYFIDNIKSTIGMRVIALLKNGEQIIINRSYRDVFISRLEDFGGQNER